MQHVRLTIVMSCDQRAVKARPVAPKASEKTTRRGDDRPAKPQRKIDAKAAPPAVRAMTTRVGILSEIQPVNSKPPTELAFIMATSVAPSGLLLISLA